MLGAVSGPDGPLCRNKACGGVGASNVKSTGDVADCRGGLAADSVAGCLGSDGDGGKAVNSSHQFAVLDFFWLTPQHESLHCKSWPIFSAGELVVATQSVTAIPMTAMPTTAMPVTVMPTVPAEMERQ